MASLAQSGKITQKQLDEAATAWNIDRSKLDPARNGPSEIQRRLTTSNRNPS
jgi:hypothetical protein